MALVIWLFSLQLLLAHGAPLFVQNVAEQTPCDVAWEAKQLIIAKLLESKMVLVCSHWSSFPDHHQGAWEWDCNDSISLKETCHPNSFIPRPSPFFCFVVVLQFTFSIIHGSGRVAKNMNDVRWTQGGCRGTISLPRFSLLFCFHVLH